MHLSERAPILREIDLMVADRSKKGDTREYVDANSLTDQERLSIHAEIDSLARAKREKGETHEQFLARTAAGRAWIGEAWERLGHPQHFSRRKRRVAILTVERQMAPSVAAAEAMIRAGLILDHYGRRITDTKVRCPENAQLTLQTERPTNRRPVVFARTHGRVMDRPAAKLGYPTPACEDEDNEHPSPSVTADSKCISQVDLEELIYRRRCLMELEEGIAVALSKGARVDTGIHTAELVPERRRGELFMKLVIR